MEKMKKKYIAPNTLMVELNLNNSVLENIGFGNGSQESGWDAAAKKNNGIFDFDEDAETEEYIYKKFSVWE